MYLLDRINESQCEDMGSYYIVRSAQSVMLEV